MFNRSDREDSPADPTPALSIGSQTTQAGRSNPARAVPVFRESPSSLVSLPLQLFGGDKRFDRLKWEHVLKYWHIYSELQMGVWGLIFRLWKHETFLSLTDEGLFQVLFSRVSGNAICILMERIQTLSFLREKEWWILMEKKMQPNQI